MSFILDALKKSESERQRQSGPALFEVKVAPPRHRFAVWAVALGALLAINLIVVGWMLSRGSAARSAAPAAASAIAPAAATPAAAAQRSSVPEPATVASSPAPAGAPSNLSARAPDTAAASAESAEPTGSGPQRPARSDAAPPPANVVPAASLTPPSGSASGADAARGAGGADAAAAPATPTASVNPDDLAPAVEPPRGTPVPDSGGSVVRESESENGLPSYQDAAAVPGANIPPLRLDFHVYSIRPDERFVFLNMMKLHEGDSLPQGVRVDTITRDGVILSYHGTRFVLQPR